MSGPNIEGGRIMPETSSRAMWSGAITFGLVTIPVKLHPAVHEDEVHFHMLHDQDHARLKRKLVCSADDKEVHPEHIVKGYEVAPDEYVIISEEELDAVQPQKSRNIVIEDFTDLSQIDPIYYDRPYYLLPQETGTKPYRLLVEAMTKTQRVGIATFVMRNKQYLAAIRPVDNVLIMETMRFSDEVTLPKDMQNIPAATKVDDRELAMAGQLIDALYGKFRPDKYKDDYIVALRDMIEQKIHGKKIVGAPAAKEEGSRSKNLLEALQASIARARNADKSQRGQAKANPDVPPPARKTRASTKKPQR